MSKNATVLTSLLLAGAALVARADAQIVINEFNTGTPDYVELRNLGSQAVDLSGWKMASWYALSAVTTTPESTFTLPAGTTIPANGFLVIEEFGTAGAPGTLPCSIAVGYNLYWTDARTVEIAIFDSKGAGADYVYLNWFGGPAHPNLPPNQTWTGSFSSGTGDEEYRVIDLDTDDASDWIKAGGTYTPGTPCALNPGQSACQFHTVYGVGCPGSGGFIPKITTPDCAGPGQQVNLMISEGLGGATALLFFGLNEVSFPIGFSGCTLYISPVLSAIVVVPLGGSGAGNGIATLAGIIPLSVPTGLTFTMQGFIADPAGAPGYCTTAGNKFVVQ